MNYLGINLRHYVRACSMVNGKVTLVLQKERFKKIKNCLAYLTKSIKYMSRYLKKNNLYLDSVVFSTEYNRPVGFINPIHHFFTINDSR